MERAPEHGKVLGPPRQFKPHQVETMRRTWDGVASLRRVSADFECSPSTVLRVLHREGSINNVGNRREGNA